MKEVRSVPPSLRCFPRTRFFQISVWLNIALHDQLGTFQSFERACGMNCFQSKVTYAKNILLGKVLRIRWSLGGEWTVIRFLFYLERWNRLINLTLVARFMKSKIVLVEYQKCRRLSFTENISMWDWRVEFFIFLLKNKINRNLCYWTQLTTSGSVSRMNLKNDEILLFYSKP